MKKAGGLGLFDWAVIGFLFMLTFLPDPTDLLDFGLPIVEPLMAAGYFMVRKFGGKTV